ncbi:unnamed protein product [Fraxinus pennsylvanica]|uniref:Uncharacterized protein n=1 Tax=Fraxinus pennsylvanica TaxID=56036 RepID=A0AAD1ZEW7_9LAMI|nr:unnamed protein product [Fraxinus pennsylvanica]
MPHEPFVSSLVRIRREGPNRKGKMTSITCNRQNFLLVEVKGREGMRWDVMIDLAQPQGSGVVDPCELLANIDIQMNKAKDEAWSRKEIMDKIDRWLAACDEENWLEDYT